MKILGIANDETSSACLVIDNKVISAVSEERFSRVKMDNSFPYKSINYVLKNSNLDLASIDYIGYGWKKGFEEQKHLLMYADRIIYEALKNPSGIEALRERMKSEIQQDGIKRKEFDNWITENSLSNKVVFFNHHECHSISAFACSPFDEALVITSDARGDFEAMQISYFNSTNKYEVLYRCPSFDSLGFFYGRITGLLGYTPAKHEGKITGLAAHGDPKKYLSIMEKMISFEDGKIIGHLGDWYRPFFTNYSETLKKFISTSKPEDVAAAAQLHLENLICKLVKYYLKIKPSKYICMAGGVFGNVRVNQIIKEIQGVKNVFIQPNMGDGGLALGSAIGVPFLFNQQKSLLSNMYLGPEFSNEEILNEIENREELYFEYQTDLSSHIIKEIKKNRVIGLFQGRMEFGPRALCNRSIIYHCFDEGINASLNKRLQRTEFMPFAPATAEELAPECYINWEPNHLASRYMTITYNCSKEMVKNSPAVVHIDDTARPQIISASDNPLMHEILLLWYKDSGGMSLVNTSFNKHEEPIVCSPKDAVDAIVQDQVDVLVIGNYFVYKSKKNRKNT